MISTMYTWVVISWFGYGVMLPARAQVLKNEKQIFLQLNY